MAQRVKKHWPLLQCLLESESKSQAIAFIKATSKEQVQTLCELVANVLYAVLPISNIYKAKLRKYKNILQSLAETKLVTSKTRNTIQRNIQAVLLLLHSVKKILQSTL